MSVVGEVVEVVVAVVVVVVVVVEEEVVVAVVVAGVDLQATPVLLLKRPWS